MKDKLRKIVREIMKEKVISELDEAQSPAQKAAFEKMLAKKDGKDESTDDEKESIIKEGFSTWEVIFDNMNLSGVKLSKKNKYTIKARNTVEAIKKAAKMAGVKDGQWIATKTHSVIKKG